MRRFLAILSLLSLANLTTARLGLACAMESSTRGAHADHVAAAPMHDIVEHARHQADRTEDRAIPLDENGSRQAGCLVMAQCAVVLALPTVAPRVEQLPSLLAVVPRTQDTPRSAPLDRDVPPPKA